MLRLGKIVMIPEEQLQEDMQLEKEMIQMKNNWKSPT